MTEPRGKIVNETNVKPFKSPQQKRQRWIAALVVLIVIGLVIGAYYLLVPHQSLYTLSNYQTATVTRGNLAQDTQASGTVVIPVQFNLPSPEAGYAYQVYAKQGDSVTKGQLLAQIEVPDLQDQLDDLVAQQQNAVLTLDMTKKQNVITNDRSQRAIDAMNVDIDAAQTAVNRMAELVKINANRKSDLESANKTLQDLLNQQTEKIKQLSEDKILQQLDVQIKAASIASTQTSIDRLKQRIASATIRSPMTGVITYVDSSVTVPGSTIAQGENLFTIVDPKSAVVQIDVLEQYAGMLKTGEQAQLTISDNNTTGTIESIGNVAQASSSGLGSTVTVTLKPAASAGQLIEGASAVGVFQVDVKPNVLLLPRGPYLTTGSQRYLYKVTGNTAQRIDVTFGDVQGNTIEILNGVQAGDVIITSGYQNFVQYPTIKLEKGASR